MFDFALIKAENESTTSLFTRPARKHQEDLVWSKHLIRAVNDEACRVVISIRMNLKERVSVTAL